MDSLTYSSLHDEKTFYGAFLDDLEYCEKEVIIESPFITTSRMKLFYPVFQTLLAKTIYNCENQAESVALFSHIN